MNFARYINNNPMSSSDPSGTQPPDPNEPVRLPPVSEQPVRLPPTVVDIQPHTDKILGPFEEAWKAIKGLGKKCKNYISKLRGYFPKLVVNTLKADPTKIYRPEDFFNTPGVPESGFLSKEGVQKKLISDGQKLLWNTLKDTFRKDNPEGDTLSCRRIKVDTETILGELLKHFTVSASVDAGVLLDKAEKGAKDPTKPKFSVTFGFEFK